MPALAQADSLMTVSDTIGVQSQQKGTVGYGYQYYGASQLSGKQLGFVLKQSPDSLARRLFGQSRRLNGVATGLTVGTLGFFIGSLTTVGRRGGPGGTLLLAGYTTLFSSFIPRTIASRRLAQAVSAHNTYLRNQREDYLPPVVYAANRQWALSMADTLAVRRVGLTWGYAYRGMPVYPGGQLARLTASLNDPEVNNGIRYVRTINQLGSLVGGIGRGLLTGYVTTLLLTRTRRYGRNTALSNELLTTGLLCVGANFVLSRHANQVQRRWVSRFNETLKQQFQTP